MRKISYIVLFGSIGLTVLFVCIWLLGFIFAGQSIGNLIHFALVLAVLSSFGILIGGILLMISLLKK
ncbi:MAG: DUF5670 family protein [Pyrinomonadaceae bacterium]